MWKKILVFFLIEILYLVFLVPSISKAYTLDIEDPLHSTTLEEIIERLVDLIFKISIVLVPLMIILAALLLVIAAGDPKKVEQAKKLISWTLIGFLIVLLSKGIIAIIKQLFGLT